MTLDEVKAVLSELGLASQWISDQTAVCVLALADETPRGLLIAGHSSLADGARVHDILCFARDDLHRSVAENTRESYRKLSLQPLVDAGWVVRHQLSTNDPSTYYQLHPRFRRLLSLADGRDRLALIGELRVSGRRPAPARAASAQEVVVTLPEGEPQSLSPGEHNLLEKAVVETLGPALLAEPQVVYLGDTAPRTGYQNRTLMRRLNLPIDVRVSLPDVILCDRELRSLLVVEAVVSSGPVTAKRLATLQLLTAEAQRLEVKVAFVSAFSSRRALRRFVEHIAWGTSVWGADEPYSMIHFVTVPGQTGETRR
jgi:hypothetical protein